MVFWNHKLRGKAEIVNHFVPKFVLLTTASENVATRRSLVRAMILLFFLGLAGGRTASAASVQNPPVSSVGPGLPFAVADFDGDLRPDVASVHAGRTGSASTDYWIQLELTAGGRQSLQVVGPIGGLRIAARDVNGDHAVDLVLTTAWFAQPVAIFLNDGHGKFSRAEPAAFPGAFSRSDEDLSSSSNAETEIVGVPPQSCSGACPDERDLPHEPSLAAAISSSSAGFPENPFLASRAGRAPPSAVLLF